MFELTSTEIGQNWKRFRNLISETFKTRTNELNAMYDAMEDRMVTMPASSIEHYHNAIPGGYVEHVLRVMDFSEREYKHWKSSGLKVDNFTLEELLFAAAHHDLGKYGLPDHEMYVPNDSKWHRENQGKIYTVAEPTPFALIQDTSLFLLQHYGVKCSWQEQFAIRIHDGLYDDANKSYYMSSQLGSKMRTNIALMLHFADMKAARFEFERWAISSPEKFTFYGETATSNKPTTNPKSKALSTTDPVALDRFKTLFGKNK